MSDSKGFRIIRYVEFLIRRKELFLLVFGVSLIVSYLLIFVLIEEQFEASATLIPREEESSAAAAGLLRNLRSLPLNLGGKTPRSDLDLYTTIITSRSLLEDVIREFGLVQVYGLDTTALDYMEKAVKRLSREVSTKETLESAFLLTVRAGTRQRAADMTNFIIRRLNERIVGLNSSRSGQNKVFLEKRVEEISADLKAAEDSLRAFQERTGLLDVKSQLQGILTAHTELETQLAAKRFQRGILERMYDKESPQVKEADLQIDVYEKKLAELRTVGDPGSPLLPLNQLPRTSVEFIRRYRAVELNNLLLEYVVPLHEQAKFDEKKDTPVLQVIDYGVPPARKSYPPRTLFALIGALSATLIVYVTLLVRDAMLSGGENRWRDLFHEARHWSWKTVMRQR
jgi:capsule polysaccharide export protein KpsE/RkpR